MGKKIIISGAGEVGSFTAELLSENGHQVTVIDTKEEKLARLDQRVEARLVKGSSCQWQTLKKAGIKDCDVVVAATNMDEINLLTGAIAKKMGVPKVISRIHDSHYDSNEQFDYAKSLDIDHLIFPEELTAKTILAQLKDPGVSAIEHFADSKLSMHKYEVQENSLLVGPPLKEINFPFGMKLVSIKRNRESILPNAETTIQKGDLVTLIGPEAEFEKINSYFTESVNRRLEIVISGGSSLSEWLVSELKSERHSIRLFEMDYDRANYLAEKYPYITVINADPLDTHTFDEEHLGKTKCFLALSDHQERNLLIALKAKKMGVPTTFAVFQDSDFLSSVDGVGIDHCYSPRMEAAKELLRLLDTNPVKEISDLGEGQTFIYEVKACSTGTDINVPLKEIRFPDQSFIAGISRDDDFIIPTATNTIQPGDLLIVIGDKGIESQLSKLFCGC